MCVDLKRRYEVGSSSDKFGEEASFERKDFLLSTENFLFVFLKFLSDISFGIDKGLLANPLGRHVILKGIAHLHIVAEHVVEAYL